MYETPSGVSKTSICDEYSMETPSFPQFRTSKSHNFNFIVHLHSLPLSHSKLLALETLGKLEQQVKTRSVIGKGRYAIQLQRDTDTL